MAVQRIVNWSNLKSNWPGFISFDFQFLLKNEKVIYYLLNSFHLLWWHEKYDAYKSLTWYSMNRTAKKCQMFFSSPKTVHMWQFLFLLELKKYDQYSCFLLPNLRKHPFDGLLLFWFLPYSSKKIQSQ